MRSPQQADIWRAAHQMMKIYKRRASTEAARLANRALDKSDMFNYELWQWVCMAIQELERSKPLAGEKKSLRQRYSHDYLISERAR